MFSPKEYDIFLKYVLRIGKKLVECGAEVRRAEDAVARICRAYGIEEYEVFAMTTQILVTIYTKEGNAYTQLGRIASTKNDLGELERINQLTRKICENTPSPEKLPIYLKSLEEHKTEDKWELLGYILAAGGFTWFFGGDKMDVLAASIIAVILFAMDRLLSLKTYHKLLYIVVSCTIAGVLANVFVYFNLGHQVDIISVGLVMLFIPALALINGIREMFYRDILVGVFRLLEAILTTMSIAAGFSIAAWIGGMF